MTKLNGKYLEPMIQSPESKAEECKTFESFEEELKDFFANEKNRIAFEAEHAPQVLAPYSSFIGFDGTIEEDFYGLNQKFIS